MNTAFGLVGNLYGKYFRHDRPNHQDIKNIIVSLTSHPKRINFVWLAIDSLLKQTYQSHKVILYLAKTDFPTGELPRTLCEQKKRGLEIRFVNDYKSATKLIPALKEYPDHIIVTADDDRIYDKSWLNILVETHNKYPGCIVCPNTRKYVKRTCNINSGVTTNDNYSHLPCHNYAQNLLPIDYFAQQPVYDTPIHGIFEGYAGVLYPPHSLSTEVHNFLEYMVFTPVADDIWFQAMALIRGTKVVAPIEELAKKIDWAPETEGTQISGLYHQHSLANDVMVFECLKTYNLFQIAGLESPSDRYLSNLKISCPMCNRPVILTSFCKEKVDCWGCLNQTARKILCVGSYDYGNIGDGMYKEIFKKKFSSFDVAFVCDTARINEKRNYIEMKSCEKDFDFDVLVIGGGGIIKNFEDKLSIAYYINLAKKLNKPYFMVSVGIQENTILSKKTLKQIKGAKIVCLRSSEDYKKIPFSNVRLCPDLGYLYPSVIGGNFNVKKKYITLIQTGAANINMMYVRAKIDLLLKEYCGSTLLVMNWGGSENPAIAKDFIEYNLFSEDVKKYYPNALVYMGNSISDELKKLRYSNTQTRKSDLTPESAIKKLSQSYFVITGRYHGVVLSKALDIPYEAMIFTEKCNAEEENLLNTKEAGKILNDLEYYVKNASWHIKNHESWTNDDRNTFINRIHLMYPSMDIPFIQAMKNKNLYNLLTIGRR